MKCARWNRHEQVPVLDSAGRVLAESIMADRDYPPFARSARDGFAVRAADLPGELQLIGEVRAGEVFEGSVGAGEAVEIMTGAPLASRRRCRGDDRAYAPRRRPRHRSDRILKPGDNFNPRGVEAQRRRYGARPGQRLGFAEIAVLAMVGRECVSVYRAAARGDSSDRR